MAWSKAAHSTDYLVYYRPASSMKWTRLSRVSGNTLRYVHKSSSKYPIKAGQTYYYMVRGYHKAFKTYGSFNASGVRVIIPKKATKPSVTNAPSPTQEPKPTATPKPVVETAEQKVARYRKVIIRMINNERQKDGTWTLKEHDGLNKAAMIRAKECTVKYDHVRPNGGDMESVLWEVDLGNSCGEILNGGGGPEDMMESWMQSPGHRACILSRGDFGPTHLGVGYYQGYCVVVFARNPDSKMTLTVDANGGTFPTKGGVSSFSMQEPEGKSFSVKEIPTPVRAGYKLKKWTSVYTDGWECNETITVHMSEPQTLKANWTKVATTPTPTPSPTATPTPTVTPQPTVTPVPTATPTPTVTPTPEPTSIPEPTSTPEPTEAPEPTPEPDVDLTEPNVSGNVQKNSDATEDIFDIEPESADSNILFTPDEISVDRIAYNASDVLEIE